MLRYMAIDLETTGLDPEQDQILEMGAIVDDLITPVDKLPYFHTRVHHDRIAGHVKALIMNAQILSDLSNKVGPITTDLAVEFFLFKNTHWGTERIIPAGKNFGSFDKLFLKKANIDCFIHRTIDPMTWYLCAEDKRPPSLQECVTRAGLPNIVKHNALDDCYDVVRLIRKNLVTPIH